LAIFINKKDKISFSGKGRPIILARGFSLAALIMTTMTITITKPDIFGTAYAEELNPPTSGRTSPNVTSTFGPNMPGEQIVVASLAMVHKAL
jgi:hypothetical protein